MPSPLNNLLILTGAVWLNFAHAHKVGNDHCDEAYFTQEASGVRCSDRHITFSSIGLPAKDHTLMRGITATNQQFPVAHDYQFKIARQPTIATRKIKPDSGPIGVAVNGVPLFDPTTQGPVDRATGLRPNALAAGELDECGGHAGRGDDYHYHIAPLCLIQQLGEVAIEQEKRPIGFAMDGYPIHALGWFDKANTVENELDACRGMVDSTGQYFYNVKTTSDWDILSCFNGEPRGFAKDRFDMRLNKNGKEITGLPLRISVSSYTDQVVGNDVCRVMQGTLQKEQLLTTDGSVTELRNEEVTIFYCNANCYGNFEEADRRPTFRGRVAYYELETSACPAAFDVSSFNTTFAYFGPAQTYKGKQSTKKKQ